MRKIVVIVLALMMVPAMAYGSLQALRWSGITFWLRDVREVEDYLVSMSKQGNLQEVRRVLRSRRIDGGVYDHRGLTALMAAAVSRDTRIADELLRAGAPVNAAARSSSQDVMAGATALMVAALRGDAEMATLLLKHGADPNQSIAIGPQPGATALSMALQSGSLALVDLLLAHRADPAKAGSGYAVGFRYPPFPASARSASRTLLQPGRTGTTADYVLDEMQVGGRTELWMSRMIIPAPQGAGQWEIRSTMPVPRLSAEEEVVIMDCNVDDRQMIVAMLGLRHRNSRNFTYRIAWQVDVAAEQFSWLQREVTQCGG